MSSQQSQHVSRASSSAASSRHGHNGNFGEGAAGGGENPLLDLLSSEREYVERLMAIVRVSTSSHFSWYAVVVPHGSQVTHRGV